MFSLCACRFCGCVFDGGIAFGMCVCVGVWFGLFCFVVLWVAFEFDCVWCGLIRCLCWCVCRGVVCVVGCVLFVEWCGVAVVGCL